MTETPELHAYWQPGCSSCLRMKEFLKRHDVPYVSVNVFEVDGAREQLMAIGARGLPIIRRGSEWANGQVLADVARIAGIPFDDNSILPPSELVRRTSDVQVAIRRFVAQVPDERWTAPIKPDRPRTYGQLAFHIVNIPDLFLDHEVDGTPLRDGVFGLLPAFSLETKEPLLEYAEGVHHRLLDWWERTAPTTDFREPADVYYGVQTRHQFLERTTWHSGQHLRQYTAGLQTLGVEPDGTLPDSTWEGLPLPSNVWDDELSEAG